MGKLRAWWRRRAAAAGPSWIDPRLEDLLGSVTRRASTGLRVLGAGLQGGVTTSRHGLRLGLSAGAGWARQRLGAIGHHARHGIVATAHGLRAGLAAGTSPRVSPRAVRSGPLPAVPPGGGAWLAHASADGTWRVRAMTGASGDGAWHLLDRQGFGDLRLLVAEAGGVMVTVQSREEGGRLVETRHRTRGHVLDGDRRDQPAMVRRCDRWLEYYYYAAGVPTGHERLSLVCLAGAGWPAEAAGRRMAQAA